MTVCKEKGYRKRGSLVALREGLLDELLLRPAPRPTQGGLQDLPVILQPVELVAALEFSALGAELVPLVVCAVPDNAVRGPTPLLAASTTGVGYRPVEVPVELLEVDLRAAGDLGGPLLDAVALEVFLGLLRCLCDGPVPQDAGRAGDAAWAHLAHYALICILCHG